MFLLSAELNSRFVVMAIGEVTLDRPEIVAGFSTILLNIRLSTTQRFPRAWRF